MLRVVDYNNLLTSHIIINKQSIFLTSVVLATDQIQSVRIIESELVQALLVCFSLSEIYTCLTIDIHHTKL